MLCAVLLMVEHMPESHLTGELRFYEQLDVVVSNIFESYVGVVLKASRKEFHGLLERQILTCDKLAISNR